MNKPPGSEALRHALVALGGDVEAGPGPGLVQLLSPAGGKATLRLFYGPKGSLSPATVETLELHNEVDDEAEGVIIVADQLPVTTRKLLNQRGISWFDRRGHLRVVAPGLWIDTDTVSVPRPRSSQRNRPAVAGPAQVSLACAYLLGDRPGVRDLARHIGLSHTAISKARSALIDAGLINGGPAVPDLFWALADTWAPQWIDLAEVPEPAPGLAATGTLAAIELGAGLATQRWPVELLGADERTVEVASLRVGVTDGDGACRIAVTPTPLATEELTAALVGGHRVVRPLFVALELAQDPARGVEALEAWTPEGVARVW